MALGIGCTEDETAKARREEFKKHCEEVKQKRNRTAEGTPHVFGCEVPLRWCVGEWTER